MQRSNDVTESNVASLGTNRVVGSVTSNNCKVGLIIMKSHLKTGFLGVSAALTIADSQMSYKLYIKGDATPGFLQSLYEGGVSYKISEIELFAPRALSLEQKRVLKSALEQGYFDNPKRISKELLSKKLGLRESALSETLRIAEKKIIRGNAEQITPVGIPKMVRAKARIAF